MKLAKVRVELKTSGFPDRKCLPRSQFCCWYSCFLFDRFRVQITSANKPAILTEVFRSFPQFPFTVTSRKATTTSAPSPVPYLRTLIISVKARLDSILEHLCLFYLHKNSFFREKIEV
jgi:hypothetical protein